jgi:hypothetical protein
MKFKIILPALLLMLLFNNKSDAQFYVSGQDPASLRWEQINSDNFQIIYPVGYDSVAQYVMNVMEYARTITLSNQYLTPKKISVILHNQTIISNAEVAWAPRRMEFNTIGPQDSYSQEWFQQLALHEYIHVLQISTVRQGFTKTLSYLFGEQIVVGIFGLYLPYWYIEGDAVVAETALSESGRGRDPNFEMELRAQLLEIGPYSLEKASLGSYQDFTTDRYHLGYFLMAQGRAEFGPNMWRYPLSNVGTMPVSIVPFSRGIEIATRMKKNAFYNWSLESLSIKWSEQLAKTDPDTLVPISQQKTFINYSQNAYLKDGSIFSLEENYHDIGRLVKFDSTGKKTNIYTPGYYMKDRISVGGDNISWLEIKYDPRWSNRKNTKLFVFNYQTGKKRKIADKQRYFSPQLSPVGEKLAVIEADHLNRNYLLILNSENGAVLNRIEAPLKTSLAHPSWNKQGNLLLIEILGLQGKSIAIVDIEKETFRQILPWQSMHILNPRFWGNYILFEAAYNGIMNIYALDLENKSLYQTTNVVFGAGDYQLNESGSELLFSNYTSLGKQTAIQKWDKEKWIPFANVENNSYPLGDILSSQHDSVMKSEHIPQKVYERKKYSKWAHLFNIHSWYLLNLDAANSSINPGLSVLSQNKLGTMAVRLGVDYSYNTDALRYYGQVDYLGWYPAISIGADYGRRWTYEIEDSDTIYYYWYETNLNTSVYIPLLYTSGVWAHNIQPQIGFQYKNIDGGKGLDFEFTNIKTMVYGVQYSVASKSPFQNIYPRWGLALLLAYRHSIEMSVNSNMFISDVSLYLPGLFRHDGFWMAASYQNKKGAGNFFSDWTIPARGYNNIFYSDLLTLRANYSVPLFYPDFNVSSLVYIKRIRLNLFYDYSLLTDLPEGRSHSNLKDFWSSGIDLMFDVHFLRSKFPFEIGLRSTYVNGYPGNPEAWVFQLLWGVSI